MIITENVTKFFGKFQALNNISFDIRKGEIVGFLGQNGAGKTTLMRILTSYLSVSSGKVIIGGEILSENSSAIRRRIGYLPENPPLYLNMCVRDYLKFSAQLKDVLPKQQVIQVDRVVEECCLKDVQKNLIRNLSKGYKQRVGIAQALIHDPEILILDEPTSGLDPVQIRQVRKLIKDVEQKRTVLLSTHILSEIENLAHRVLMIKAGKVIADDSLDNLLHDPEGGKVNLEEVFLKLNGCEDE